jgi:predicted 3-demethylubiquinone-9 3-methyltransferase (glyoxalase superfamily)
MAIIHSQHQKITPFLWFDSEAQEAAQFYCSVFENSKLINSSPFITSFELEGLHFEAINGGPQFQFNESVSFFVDCEDQDEVDYYWNAFIDNGGTESQCAWLKDKYGLSWQIVPKQLRMLIQDPDREKANKAMQAMLKMKKIIVQDLLDAFNS